MRTSTKSITALLTAGAIAVALAGCAQPTPAAEGGSSAPAAESTPSAEPTPAAMIDELTGESTAIKLDAGFVEALGSLKLTPGTIGSATLSDEGVLSFPITGGNVTYYDPATGVRPYVQGEIDHDGSGLSLTGGDTKVELKDFVIDPGNDSKVLGDVFANGKMVVEGANLFRLDGSTLNPVTANDDGAYVLQGTTVYVSEDAAALLNETFGTDAVTGDLEVGIATVTVTG